MSQVSIALDVRANLGECPRWDEQTQHLYWVDINNKQLHRFNPATGEDQFLTFEQEIGCFALRQQGGFVLAMRHGFYVLNGWNTDLQFITDPEAHLENNRFNDGRVDAAGRLWAGSVYPPKDYNGASIYSLNPDGTATRQVSDLLTANGIAFSPDSRTLYYATPSWPAILTLPQAASATPVFFTNFPSAKAARTAAVWIPKGFIGQPCTKAAASCA
jgi:sugar lactone lactonase YvrE